VATEEQAEKRKDQPKSRASQSGINQRVEGCALQHSKKPTLTTEAAEGSEKDLQHPGGCLRHPGFSVFSVKQTCKMLLF
jgi:hypothetical protein